MSGSEDEFDELVEELDDLDTVFRERAREDSQKRQSAEAQPSADGTGITGVGNGSSEEEFTAETHLVVPHDQMGNQAQRPLDRRPDGPPPLRSVALSSDAPTKSFTGTSQGMFYDYTIPVVTNGDTYTIECTVHNLGGMAADATTVELFVEHLKASATVDLNTGTGEVELHPSQVPPTVGGFTTLPPESRVTVVSFQDQGGGLTETNQLNIGLNRRVEEDRSFAARTFGGKPRTFLGPTSDAPSGSEFTLRVYDSTDVSIPGAPNPQSEHPKIVADRIAGTAPLLAEVPGRYTTNVTTDIRETELVGSVGTLEQVGQAVVTLPQRTNVTASVQYTHSPPSGLDGGTTVLYARAYSIAPEDAPGNWGELDHTTMRHVGRSELYWDSRVP